MQYSSIPSILEDDDIAAVERISSGTTAADGPLGELPAQTLPDGRTALPVLLILHAPSERDNAKTYGGAGDPLPFPLSFHLTNGVEHQTVPILPAGTQAAAQAEAAVPAVPAEPSAQTLAQAYVVAEEGTPATAIFGTSADVVIAPPAPTLTENPARARRRSAAATEPEAEPESEAPAAQEVPSASGEPSAQVDSEQPAGKAPPAEQVSEAETVAESENEAGAEPA